MQDWQPYPIDPYSCYMCVTIHPLRANSALHRPERPSSHSHTPEPDFGERGNEIISDSKTYQVNLYTPMSQRYHCSNIFSPAKRVDATFYTETVHYGKCTYSNRPGLFLGEKAVSPDLKYDRVYTKYSPVEQYDHRVHIQR